ncbi:DUF4145 domain-containing protein [Citrobacter portucalensis]|uniref:DUF4145 domain-containing protein n=1 Tax=Citrobacter portucalensis TaxID=1639133 RepID=UPI002113740E|nr:DUF4145 domain-containing protein [Citrobacter portucalensis]MCQ6312547.1 DUF4145 domain-containing protein [Citrobacter portucalensis]
MPTPPKFKTKCPLCQRECNTLVHGQKQVANLINASGIEHNYGIDHKILECCGCELVFYYRDAWSYDKIDAVVIGKQFHMISTIPDSNKAFERPMWGLFINGKDEVLYKILCEVYSAAEHGLFILASIGLRTAFDRTTEIIGINPNLRMFEKVNAVFEQGYVGKTERDQLDVITNAGNAAAHRGWTPQIDDLIPMLRTMERFIEKAVLQDTSIEEIGKRIPKRPGK